MYISLTPTDTTLYRGQSYTFRISASSSYSVKYIYCSLSFFEQGSGGWDPIISGYDFEYRDDEGFYNDSLSWSQTVTVPSNAIKATLYFSCVEAGSARSSSIDYSVKTYIPTVAPSNFVAVQNGKHVRFTWTAGSGDGTMSYLVTIGGDQVPPGCEVVTGTESTWTDCHDYYNRSVQFKLLYYLNGSIKGSIAYQLNIGTPSASTAIDVVQASKAKQVTVSWSGSYSRVSPTSITFTVTCSGSSGNLYSGGSAGSVAYTPPQYGTSYTYVVNYVAKNAYGDTFSATASKAFSAAAPYHTIGIFDHGQWKQCIVHIYQNGWKECYVHVFRNNEWKLCDGS